jgi:hypothetical protein
MRYSHVENCSTTRIVELRPPLNGRSYFLLDNQSGFDVRFDYGIIPNQYSGLLVKNGSRYEIEKNVPGGTIFIIGTQVIEQAVIVTEDQFPQAIKPRTKFRNILETFGL